MPGHRLLRSGVKDAALFDKYQCPHCQLLLKDAVQPLCGHWLCESCAVALLQQSSPKCPLPGCQESLKSNVQGDAEHFPDRFVRREINGMIVHCIHQHKGCKWEDKLAKLEAHLETCDFTSEECPQCGTILTPEQVESHKLTCPKAMVKCPLVDFGCLHSQTMTREELEQHVREHGVQHLNAIADVLKILTRKANITAANNFTDDGTADHSLSLTRCADLVEKDGANQSQASESKYRAVLGSPPDPGYGSMSVIGRALPDNLLLNAAGLTAAASKLTTTSTTITAAAASKLANITSKLKGEIDSRLTAELRHRDEEIATLRSTITKMEKSMRSKHAEFEDRDFRLSLIENSNYDGAIIWKIPQFSQRMSDAQTGKYTSIFSLPFYTGRYGYKMCLRLYILGDGIGKNSHMSLFFVIMKGEFDNILQWPFTHKVTFKLINQTGGRDIIDTFQPDPMSSSFRKPKSDMNIASGCPRFVSHTELKSGGFIQDDTVFIKCSVDCASIRHP